MHLRKKIIFGLIFFLVLPLILNPMNATIEKKIENNGFTNNGNPDGIWTVMLYYCADTRDSVVSGVDNSGNFIHQELNIVKAMLDDEISQSVGSDLNVIMLYDYPYHSSQPQGNAYLYEITSGAITELADWGVTNMGSSTTLSNFISYCKSNYPADYYSLTLADHGRGYAGICYDYHAPHPYLTYALGDCLELDEIESALSGGNEVDVLFLDCCQGASFELAWQLGGEVDYMVGSQSPGSPYVMHHARDIIYELSRDILMLPRDLAMVGFNSAKNPVHVPSGFDHWGSVVAIDVALMNDPGSASPGFKSVFDTFTDWMYTELNTNYSVSRDLFLDIRNSCTTWGLDSTRSMMVDALNMVNQVIAYNESLNYPDTLVYANMVKDWLTNGPDKIVIDEWYWYPDFTFLHGFDLCFPDTADMYQGFLWPNMYDGLKISLETSWGAFLNSLFPTPDFKEFRLPDLFHIFIHPLDPVSRLHIYFEDDRLARPLHVGLNKEFDYEWGSMGVELGIEGAEYYSDLQFGNTMIYIPVQSIQIGMSAQDAGFDNLKVVIETSATTEAMRTVNLTVKRIAANDIIWEDNQIMEVEPGTIVSCELTNDSVTDLVVEETSTNSLGIIDGKEKIASLVIFPSIIILIIIGKRKSRNKRNY